MARLVCVRPKFIFFHFCIFLQILRTVFCGFSKLNWVKLKAFEVHCSPDGGTCSDFPSDRIRACSASRAVRIRLLHRRHRRHHHRARRLHLRRIGCPWKVGRGNAVADRPCSFRAEDPCNPGRKDPTSRASGPYLRNRKKAKSLATEMERSRNFRRKRFITSVSLRSMATVGRQGRGPTTSVSTVPHVLLVVVRRPIFVIRINRSIPSHPSSSCPARRSTSAVMILRTGHGSVQRNFLRCWMTLRYVHGTIRVNGLHDGHGTFHVLVVLDGWSEMLVVALHFRLGPWNVSVVVYALRITRHVVQRNRGRNQPVSTLKRHFRIRLCGRIRQSVKIRKDEIYCC